MKRFQHVIITNEYPPNSVGGISRFMQMLAAESTSMNDVQIITIDKNSKKDCFFQNDQIKIAVFGARSQSIFLRITRWEDAKIRIAKYVEALNLTASDVLEFNETEGIAEKAIYSVLKRNTRPKLICSSTNPTFLTSIADGRPGFLGELRFSSELACLNMADIVIAPTEYASGQLFPHLKDPSSLLVIKPTFSQQQTFDSEGKVHECVRDIDILYFGRQQTLKGFKDFVAMLSSFEEEILSGEIIVGILGAQHIIFPEGIPSNVYLLKNLGGVGSKVMDFGHQKNVNQILARSRVVLVPSRIDWSPNSVVESLLMGANVVTTFDTGALEMSKLVKNGADASFGFRSMDISGMTSAVKNALISPNHFKELKENPSDSFRSRQFLYTQMVPLARRRAKAIDFQGNVTTHMNTRNLLLNSFQTNPIIKRIWLRMPDSIKAFIIKFLIN